MRRLLLVSVLVFLAAPVWAQEEQPKMSGNVAPFLPSATRACISKVESASVRLVLTLKATEYDMLQVDSKVADEKYILGSDRRQELHDSIGSLIKEYDETKNYVEPDLLGFSNALLACDKTVTPLKAELERLTKAKLQPVRRTQLQVMTDAYQAWRDSFKAATNQVTATAVSHSKRLTAAYEVREKIRNSLSAAR